MSMRTALSKALLANAWLIPAVVGGTFAIGGCVHHHHDDDDHVVVVDEHGYRHEGYYDRDRAWHGGWHDEHNGYHEDPHDWHH